MLSTEQDYRNTYTDKTVDVNILTGTAAYADVIAAKSANHQIFIQRITLSITTHIDDTYLFDDDGSGPPIASYIDEATAATTGQGQEPVVIDFGPKGRPLTLGANLDISHSSTGVAIVHVEAYERLMGVISSNAGASLQ